jgi:hypothetical protein
VSEFREVIAVQVLALLLRIREVFSSSLDLKPATQIIFFAVFLGTSWQMLGWYLKVGHDHFHIISNSPFIIILEFNIIYPMYLKII